MHTYKKIYVHKYTSRFTHIYRVNLTDRLVKYIMILTCPVIQSEARESFRLNIYLFESLVLLKKMIF